MCLIGSILQEEPLYRYINCTLSLRPTSYGPGITGSNFLLFFGLAKNYPSGYRIIIISKKLTE